MAWDTERTRQLLLDAATVEFSNRGLAGGRVDRISDAAGVNKERIYKYFGSKSELFDTVVATEMARTMKLISIEGSGREAVLDYAGRMFDYHRDNSTLARLLFWEGLEGRPPSTSPERVTLSLAKVDNIMAAVPGLRRSEAAELLLGIITLCCGQPLLSQLDRLLVGSADAARRRAMTLKAVASWIDGLTVA